MFTKSYLIIEVVIALIIKSIFAEEHTIEGITIPDNIKIGTNVDYCLEKKITIDWYYVNKELGVYIPKQEEFDTSDSKEERLIKKLKNLTNNPLEIPPVNFNVDDKLSLYMIYGGRFIKFSSDGKILKKKKGEYYSVCDIKWYNNQLYFCDRDQNVIVKLDTDNLKKTEVIEFPVIEVPEPAGFQYDFSCVFDQSNLYLRVVDRKNQEHNLKYIYNLKTNKFTANDSNFSIVSMGCQGCDREFLKKLTFMKSNYLYYVGQSERYTVLCHLGDTPEHFYIFDKKEKIISFLGKEFNRKIKHYITITATNPFNFIDNNTAFIQTLDRDSNNKIKNIIYYKFVINKVY